MQITIAEKPRMETKDTKPSPSVLEARGITKRFPGVVANDNISLLIRGGEIHTLLGENGAGKSTLMNVLAGMLQPDEGRILINGAEVSFKSPIEALEQGIGTVYQHFTLVPNLSVVENVVLGTSRGMTLDLKKAEEQLATMQSHLDMAVSPYEEVGHLSIGWQQRVEILKVLYRGSQIVLLDEPTSVLTPIEVKELFQILIRLKADGVGVVFITHKLDEALDISDRVTVLSRGKRIGEVGSHELARQERESLSRKIVRMMFEECDLTEVHRKSTVDFENQRMCRLNEVSAFDDRGTVAIRNLSFSIRAGEIIGIAGVDGNGQKEMAEVIAGQRRISDGQITIANVDITNKGTAAAAHAGVGYVTDDRLGEAVVPTLTVAENAVLKVFQQTPFSRFAVMNHKAIEAHTRGLIRDFNVKTPGSWTKLGTLSGGNIQKLLLARELALRPKVLVCNKPTHGLDFMTSQFVLQTIRSQADEGMAVLLISSELEVLFELSDRIGVMYRGQLLEIYSRDEVDRETVGRLMLGIKS
jgi:simple sugar transport system ATP-binding protein